MPALLCYSEQGKSALAFPQSRGSKPLVPATSSAQDAHRDLARRLVLALALIQLFYQVALLCKGIEFIADRVSIETA